ncbi:unnamed protein product [Phaedon cochleariae]|uniref:DNA mismatch repair protein S5 domain-containing protein n=1 Tax=Phaedon cochleariae TaxID=80249 RepID=A0A9N9SD92_PHACE|nr:unnamed protein product [Phaedon cochleariae]
MAVPQIKKLDEDVINRIAAGEVIQRPANALKELLENSLDAEATNIQITVKNGGLKLLQIQDNGIGIRRDDFGIVCERFTTSKLREFEDLNKICTYGFRGEALASISHVAHLTITSKTASDVCAYQASFVDGLLQGTPKPMAGNQGTIITVEDLFYNMNVRKKALRSPAEEYQKVADVVGKYAIHNASVGFAFKKSGDNNDIRTPQNSSHIENIRIIYGNEIAKELMEFSMENQMYNLKLKGYITNVYYSTKKFQFLLFINNRLVDCQSLKKCIDHVYSTYLPKNTHPFVYLSLELDPSNIDVNVHPTKHEIHFLNQEQIIETIASGLESKLLGSNNSRKAYTQLLHLLQRKFADKFLTLGTGKTVEEDVIDKHNATSKNINPNSMVRTDHREQKLDRFFTDMKKPELNVKGTKNIMNDSLTEEEYQKHNEMFMKRTEDLEDKILDKTVEDQTSEELVSGKEEESREKSLGEKEVCPERKLTKKRSGNSSNVSHIVPRTDTQLTSILTLRKEIEENCHRGLRECFSQHVFVGCVSRSQALIQFGTKLFLCNTKTILAELFYQFLLYHFQNFDSYKFSNRISIHELAMIGLEMPETGWTQEDGEKSVLAKRIVECFGGTRRAMLLDYFCMEIDELGNICSLPILVEDYLPDPKSLPMYVIRLATEVNWDSEKEFFESFARETSKFYAEVPNEINQNGKSWQWVTEFVLFPAIKNYFIPPKSFTENGAILEIANLPNLYKVFERC